MPEQEFQNRSSIVHVSGYTRNQGGKIVSVGDYDRHAVVADATTLAIEGVGSVAGNAVPMAPAGVDIDANIDEALRHKGNLLWFHDHVAPHGPWDYKRRGRQFEEFGNFNYGATGSALGLSEGTLLRMAGRAQVERGTSRPEWGAAPTLLEAILGIGGQPPFGDDPDDQASISRGVWYYHERNKRKR